MNHDESIQRNIEEFIRVQRYMKLANEKDSEQYLAIKERYTALKVILASEGVNITEIDYMKE